jgi:hypothetical protein
MLRLEIELEPEKWDEAKEEFIPPITTTIELEHSLVSLSKWESKYCKPFISKEAKTYDETLDYIQFMTLTPNVDLSVYEHLTDRNVEEINRYIEAPMTATTVPDTGTGISRETVTAELVYYWMTALNIPDRYESWHLNRLLTLIKVCNFKNRPPKNVSAQDVISRNKALNAARKKKYNTKG